MGSNTATVSNSYATGNVNGTSSLGGLMGSSTGPVSNTYATGNVTGTSTVGGLMGSSTGTVSDSYATGAVSGTSSVGGLMGTSTNTVSNSYWNTDTSGQPTSPGGTGLTSSQMLQSANFNSWDFANTWTIYNGVTNPLLQSFMTPLTVTANNATKTYDGQAYSGGNGVTYSGPPNGNLLGTVSYGGASQGAIHAGNYVIAPAGLYSNQQGYIISYGSGMLTVTAAPLTAGLTGTVTKTYDGTTAATLAAANYTLAGVLGSDTVALNNPTAGSYDSSQAGPGKTVTVTGLVARVTRTEGTVSSA
jgi:YDG domain